MAESRPEVMLDSVEGGAGPVGLGKPGAKKHNGPGWGRCLPKWA
jgi:hypothetical protein